VSYLRRLYYRIYYLFKRPLTRDAKVERQALESAAIVCERMAWTHRSATVVLYEAARRIRRLHGETVDSNFTSEEVATPRNRKG